VYSVYGDDTYVSSTDYDAAGRVDLRTLGNGRRTDYVYYNWTDVNGLGRVKYIKTGTTSSPTSLQYMYYVYDAVGNVTQIKDYRAGGTQTQSFSYDALDRLKTAAASGGTGGTYSQKSYSYNAIGNITNFEGTAYYYQDAAHKHAVTHLNGTLPAYQKYWYDANGNMTTRKVGSNTYTLTYDAENRLTSVSGAASATFVYDGDGNRIKATFGSATTVYVGNHFEWTGSTTTMKKYYYAGGARVAMREGSNVLYYILTDHLGSTAITVSNGGSEYGELRYYPYGGTRYTSGTTPTSRRFTGQISDDTIGLYFYNARYYDAALGRFVQADTIVPSLGDPQSLNRYSYVLNSP
jgi:RHS repeat-associated protein